MMRRLIPTLFLVTLAAACGGSHAADDGSGAEAYTKGANDPGDQTRLAIFNKVMKKAARNAAADFSKATKTTPLTDLVDVTCAGKPTTSPPYPDITIADCQLTFKNGTGTTTFAATLTGDITLKGQPDYRQKPDAKGAYPPASKTLVYNLGASAINVMDGIVPAITPPISVNDKDALAKFADELVQIAENNGAEQGGGDWLGGNDDSSCGEVDDPPTNLPNGSRPYCYGYLADRWEGQMQITFEVKNDMAVGVRWIGFGGNF
jgi:hypothetical protein